MKNTLKLDSRLTSDGNLKTSKSVLREYYKKVQKGVSQRDKEAGIDINLVLYPKFFSESRKETVLDTEESNIDKAARIQNTSPEAIRILHKSQGSIKVKDFSKKVLSISKM
ncbi:MAG: hypothetical protein KDC42_10805 [Ignavibacteriae bacterium]|nr:hypothetical protein [Ignavibacteriota bacterium]